LGVCGGLGSRVCEIGATMKPVGSPVGRIAKENVAAK
jgi:hypothetical protein